MQDSSQGWENRERSTSEQPTSAEPDSNVTLAEGYLQMAADQAREWETEEWVEALIEALISDIE